MNLKKYYNNNTQIIKYLFTTEIIVSTSASGLKSDFFCSEARQIFIQPVIAFKDLNQTVNLK